MSWAESKWITENIVKSIQRGTTTGAQTVTIQAVNMDKSLVFSVSKGSAGYVAARGNITGNLKGSLYRYERDTLSNNYDPNEETYSATLSGTRALSGGSTDLTTKQYSAQLVSSTQLQCDGACEWQVIEFY